MGPGLGGGAGARTQGKARSRGSACALTPASPSLSPRLARSFSPLCEALGAARTLLPCHGRRKAQGEGGTRGRGQEEAGPGLAREQPRLCRAGSARHFPPPSAPGPAAFALRSAAPAGPPAPAPLSPPLEDLAPCQGDPWGPQRGEPELCFLPCPGEAGPSTAAAPTSPRGWIPTPPCGPGPGFAGGEGLQHPSPTLS
ncbi:natural resistance-associated macrophage protein 2 [Platysternon megacephalum]|uniref:Natural resistance-associated macrophage protein 2 n=1 Tax=Platysternon megacephalum TaxID=55544 RepID=A0A4D9EB20_9SAUR|nr:natural resistance-associated macrophage protein 2 [Platysternon megacephalum]